MINPIIDFAPAINVRIPRTMRATFELHMVDSSEALLDYLNQRGQDAYKFRSSLPGLILFDLGVPRHERHAAFSAIKADPVLAGIPIVMLTTSQGKAQNSRVYNLGGVTYLSRAVPFVALPDLLGSLNRNPVVMLTNLPLSPDGHRTYSLGGTSYRTIPAHAVSHTDLLRSLGKYWSFELVALKPKSLAA